ncbi:hypothetical protein SAMN04488128_1011210 [Chitinophaga eiseniae]|uniref:Uncharacterized protein n=1 Tax=Chitinophaga eiseniae TaxID=634771 RepID=A0A1T4MPT7_9BACT|nr:hypothetical protein SAMN04488128_1011210 [Chitinophaga eiseniae]
MPLGKFNVVNHIVIIIEQNARITPLYWIWFIQYPSFFYRCRFCCFGCSAKIL